LHLYVFCIARLFYNAVSKRLTKFKEETCRFISMSFFAPYSVKSFPVFAILVLASCSQKDGVSEVEEIIKTTPSQIIDQGALNLGFTDQVDGNFIDENGMGFKYAIGLHGKDLASHVEQGTWQPDEPLPLTGTAQFETTYNLAAYINAEVQETETGYALNAEVVEHNGTLMLTADFETLSLAGNDTVISVSADLSKNTVTGRVYYDGMAGTLEGRISPDFVQGAFQGQGDGKIFAGGLKGSKVQP